LNYPNPPSLTGPFKVGAKLYILYLSKISKKNIILKRTRKVIIENIVSTSKHMSPLHDIDPLQIIV